MSLCLAAGSLVVSLATNRLTLAWRHSVEKTLWEEVWEEAPGGLRVVTARVRGSGAGMDPPPEARFRDGAWEWRPSLPALPAMVLRRSGYTADYRICIAGACRPMADYLPPDADPVTLKPCLEHDLRKVDTGSRKKIMLKP